MKKGFTLSEVLITLGVIGIVAALTMPMLIPRLEKVKTEAKLKKFYTTIAIATSAAVGKHGDLSTWDYSGAKTIFDTYYKDELQILGSYYYPRPGSDPQMYIVLKDGTCAYLDQNISDTYGNRIANTYWTVNLNCGKFPQQEGLTIFQMNMYNFIDASKLCHYMPSGCGYPGDKFYSPSYASRKDKATCGINSNYAWKSYECFLKIVQDGFVIKDDYNFFKQPREGSAISDKYNYWNKIR